MPLNSNNYFSQNETGVFSKTPSENLNSSNSVYSEKKSDDSSSNNDDFTNNSDNKQPTPEDGPSGPRQGGIPIVVVLLLLALLIFLMPTSWSGGQEGIVSYGLFVEQLKLDNVSKVKIVGTKIAGEFKTEPINPEYIAYCEKEGITPPVQKTTKTSPASNVEQTQTEVKKNPASAPDAAIPQDKPALENPIPEPSKEVNVKDALPVEKTNPTVLPKTREESKSDSAKAQETKPSDNTNATNKNKSAKPVKRGFFLRVPPEKLPKKFYCTAPLFSLQDESFNQLLTEKLGENYEASEPADYSNYLALLSIFVTIGLFVLIWVMMRRSRDQMGGGFMSGFSRSPAKRFEPTPGRTTFKDVAGLEGVKKELEEIVEYLKNPAKFARLGARIPKGVLLNGPPGTGKTLLARAVAGEAGVPFFSINGSEFIQMFVGVGASRVRDLFGTAKEQAPAILFIDEIDAVGRLRGTGVGGGHDEREQTLNQILSEMDGFAPNESVIVMAATNRPDVLDPALLRPGRFDRHITVDRPTAKGRMEMFQVHTKDVPLASDVDLQRLAASTIGLTGADIRNIVNEAALWATRQDKDAVDMKDFEYAKDKIIMGAKREEILNEKERRMTAFHEAGHALIAWMTPGSERVNKVTIVPRGFALGVTQLVPDEDRLSISESQIRDRLAFIMGGRAAEKVVFGEVTAGAENDIKQSTSLAKRMVTSWGMSQRIGPTAFHASEEHPFLGKEISTSSREFSEHTAQIIDEEIMQILQTAANYAEQMLQTHRNKLDALAEALLIKEELVETEIESILGIPAYRQGKNDDDSNAVSEEKQEIAKNS